MFETNINIYETGKSDIYIISLRNRLTLSCIFEWITNPKNHENI